MVIFYKGIIKGDLIVKKEKNIKAENNFKDGKLKLSIAVTSTVMALLVIGILGFWFKVLSQGNIDKSSAPVSDCDHSLEKVKFVSMSDNNIELGKGLSYQLTASGENLTWDSSNKEIADVDEKGLVKGVNVGECIVTVTAADGQSAQCHIHVKKTCYLTFDDGPNENTEAILDVLKEYNVRATFFVVSSKYLNLTSRMQEQGCLIGMHTYSHDYEKCYKTYYSYYCGLEKLSEKIESYTGTTPNVIRFPGGTGNTVSDPLLMKRVVNGATDLGYRAFDWTATAGDTSPTRASSKLSISKVQETCTEDVEIILMHDKKFNVEALKTIIPYLRDNGYVFETLDKYPEYSYTNAPKYKGDEPSTSVSTNKDSAAIKVEKTVKLTAKMTPSNSTDYVRWESSDETIAQVTADGLVTGISKGKVNVTAITSSGNMAVCEITVE